LDAILDGHLTLIDIQLPSTALEWNKAIDADSSSTAALAAPLYQGIAATFCHISWDLDKILPLFVDLQQSSFLCPTTKVTLDLWTVARQAQDYDTATTQTTRDQASSLLYHLPTAVIFHESKSGSTVVTNALQAVASSRTRVYAEAPAVTSALLACSSTSSTSKDTCPEASHTQLVQDVFFLLGRVGGMVPARQRRSVFYKVPSYAVAAALPTFVRAMPTTPWMYVYRDSIEVLMSHFAHHQQPGRGGGNAVVPRNFQPDCLQGYATRTVVDTMTASNATHKGILSELVRQAGKTMTDLSREEYCAAYIAAWCTAAVRQHGRSPSRSSSSSSSSGHWIHPAVPILQGVDPDAMPPSDPSTTATTTAPHWFVNYNELPFVLWETLLPALWSHVGGPSSDEIQKMLAATKVHSHSGSKQQAANTRGGHWKEDATLKRGQAPLSIQEAAQLFMDPVYAQMESIRTAQSQPPSD
jgi:hypothetical protein